METVLERLQEKGIHLFLESFSALDRYFSIKDPGSVHLLTDSSLVSLAQVFEELQFPGLPYEDACVVSGGCRYVFRCVDDIKRSPPQPFTAQNLIYSCAKDAFLDPRGIYRDLRATSLVKIDEPVSAWIAVMDAAKLVARYHYNTDHPATGLIDDNFVPSPDMQRELLVELLTSRYPEKGLALLFESRFIETFWPELHEMSGSQHSKEYHPEGDAWEHTLETFRHRKKSDLTLSAALLLHDVGKPVSVKLKDKPFKDHAELGAQISSSFLRYLGFSADFVRDVAFLIRYHMLPAALKRLPLYRTRKLMDSPLFPLLLELYRADISSTYRSPDSYYEACRVYKSYRRQKRNPYSRLKKSKYRR